MTTQSTLTQRGIDRYAHIEPLPDPPEEERDMEQFDGIEELRFRDPATGEFLLTPEESREAKPASPRWKPSYNDCAPNNKRRKRRLRSSRRVLPLLVPET